MSEVADLNPQRAAAPANAGAEPPQRRKPQPGVRRKAFAAFLERAIEHQKFAAVRKVERDSRILLIRRYTAPANTPSFEMYRSPLSGG